MSEIKCLLRRRDMLNPYLHRVRYNCRIEGPLRAASGLEDAAPQIEGTVDIEWYKDPDGGCRIEWVGVYPLEVRQRGFGTQALYEELEEMNRARCRGISGISIPKSGDYWRKIVPSLEPLVPITLPLRPRGRRYRRHREAEGGEEW